MRIYELFDTLTRFEFSLRYYKGKEYLALDENLIIEELKVSEFKLNNFYISQEFLNTKLNEILHLLKYLQKVLLYNIDKSEGEYYHSNCFRVMLEEFTNKGVNVSLDPYFDGNTKILYHLSIDLKNNIERRIDIVESIQNSYDYIFENKNDHEVYVLNDQWKNYLYQAKTGEITKRDWSDLKFNKYPELTQTDDYKKFFNKQGLIQFQLFKDKIDDDWSRKEKYVMFVKVLDIKGYFKENLSRDLMVRFANLLFNKSFVNRDFDVACRYQEKWLKEFHGFEISTVR